MGVVRLGGVPSVLWGDWIMPPNEGKEGETVPQVRPGPDPQLEEEMTL